MKAKKIVLLIALGVLLAGFLLWAVGAALGAKTLYLQNGELTVGDQPMGGFSIGSDVSVAASSKEGAAGLPAADAGEPVKAAARCRRPDGAAGRRLGSLL